MPTRLLCLHGMGTRASIFSSQTASFRELLPPSYEFVFADGTVECEPAPEVREFFPGPYLCWYTSPSSKRVAAAHEHLRGLISDKGPFDVVMGFSQGAALAASLLLHHQIESPNTPPPFKAAIFIASPLPFSKSIKYGIDARSNFHVDTTQPSRPNCPNKVPEHLVTDPAYLKGEVETVAVNSDGDGVENEKATYYQMFHDTVDAYRITVPTLHIYGKKDKWRRHSGDVYKLCDPALATSFEHDLGHDVPAAYAEEIADAIEGLMFKIG